MAGIATTIQLGDAASKPLRNIVNALNMTSLAFSKLQSVGNTAFDDKFIKAYRSEITQAEIGMKSLAESTGAAGTELASLGNSNGIDALNSSQQSLNNSMQQGIGKANNLMKSLGGFALIAKAVHMVTQSIGGGVARYDTLNRFPVILEKMGFEAENAQASINRLSAGIKGLPTTLDGIASTTQRIAILTKNLDNATLTSLALNNAFLSSSSSAEDTSRGMEQYIQMLSKGTVDKRAWQTLQETMGYGLDKLAESFGFAGSSATVDLYDALREGDITFDQLNGRLVELDQELGGFAELAKTSTIGIGTAFTNMKTAVVRGITNIITAIDNFLSKTPFQSIENVVVSLGNTLFTVFDGIAAGINFVADHMGFFSVIISGLVAALAIYTFGLIKTKVATLAAAAANAIFNAILAANPVTLVIIGVTMLATALYQLANHFLNTAGTATSALGVITGGIGVVIAFFYNLLLVVGNIATGMGNVLSGLALNIMIAFENSLLNVEGFFYNLLSTALDVVAQIAAQLNKLPFIEFDFSGITSAASNFAAKSLEASSQKIEYVNLLDSFNEGMKTFDTFEKGWAQKAFDDNTKWGDAVTDKIKGMFNKGEASPLEKMAYDYSDSLASISEDTSSMSDSLKDTKEDIKFLIDMAEREVVNKFTTMPLQVSFDMQNSISNDIDLDSMVIRVRDTLIDSIYEAAAEGMHV